MKKKNKIIIIIIIGFLIVCTALLLNNFRNQYEVTELGSNENGTVYKIIAGNPFAIDTVALIIGVHPREHEIHEAINDTISTITANGGSNDLSKKYVIYYIKINENITSKSDTRPAGEIIANNFIVPDIKSENPFIVIDIHEIDKNFEYSDFIYPVSNNSKTNEYANQISNVLNIPTYTFKEGTSPQLVTEPIASQDLNTLIFETSIVNSVEDKKNISQRLIYVIDKLKP